MKFDRRYVEKPWGLAALPPMFDPPAGKKIGEVWFTGGGDLPLLLKNLFTSERLSVQVHPDDGYARAHGHPHGKTECWYVLGAQPDSTIALGLLHPVSKDELRAAALDGSIEQLMDWKPVRTGDFFFVPPGTIHAIGSGISLLEFQQNIDLTYRLYDYGRPRELHLDAGVAVAHGEPYGKQWSRHLPARGEVRLVDGPHFRLIRLDGPPSAAARESYAGKPLLVIPVDATVELGEETLEPGACGMARDIAELAMPAVGRALIAQPV